MLMQATSARLREARRVAYLLDEALQVAVELGLRLVVLEGLGGDDVLLHVPGVVSKDLPAVPCAVCLLKSS
jgi:hypothetical protein